MIPLVIVGAGSAGRFYRQIIDDINTDELTYEFVGFVDDTKTGPEIIGRITDIPTACRVVLGVNWSRSRALLAHRITTELETLIHPTALIGRDVILGPGSVLGPNVTLGPNVELGQGTHLNVGVSVHQGTQAGGWLTMGPGARVCGDCTIGSHVEIGANAVIVNLHTVGDGARIGACAAVVSDVARNITVGGVPARRLR